MDLDPFTQKRTYRIEGLFQRQDKSSTIKNEKIVEVVITSQENSTSGLSNFFQVLSPTVKDEIYKSKSRYNARVNNHHDPLVTQLLDGPDPQTKKKIPFRLNP